MRTRYISAMGKNICRGVVKESDKLQHGREACLKVIMKGKDGNSKH